MYIETENLSHTPFKSFDELPSTLKAEIILKGNVQLKKKLDR